MIRAKFRLTEWKNSEGGRRVDGKYESCILASLVFIPVGDDSPENKQFWEATPSGRIELGVVNPEAVEEFELLKEYYVDFTEVKDLPDSTQG